MSDQSIEVMIKTVADLKAGDLTIRQQRELQKAIEATGRGADVTMRQLRSLEQAAARVQSQRSQAADAAARQNPPPIIPPPLLPTEAGGAKTTAHGGKAMVRHSGAVAGQILGMPGLGMLAAAGGMAAGIGVTIGLLEKGVRLLGQWNDKIQEFIHHGRSFETFEMRVDSLSLRMQALRQHNQEVAQSMSFIGREVNSVSAAVAHQTELLKTQLDWEQKLADARLQFTLTRIRLANLFNPLERIKLEAEAEEKAFRERIARERQDELNKIASMALQQRLAEQRRTIAEAEVNMIQETLPGKQQEADVAADAAEATVEETKARHEKLEAERAFVKQMANGSLVPGFGLKGYMGARADMIPTDGFSELDKTIASAGQTGAIALGLGNVPPGIQAAARRRLAQIDKENRGLADKRIAAKALARAKAAAVRLLENQQEFSEGEARSSEKTRQEAERAEGEARELFRISDPARKAAAEDAIRSLNNQMKIDQIQAAPQPAISVPGGGVSAGEEAENIRLLREISEGIKDIKQVWQPA